MVDKPRKPGHPTGPKAGFKRGARPGSRPEFQGRSAGKPGRGPAPSRRIAGVDVRDLERLEQEGLLSEEGRRLRREAGTGGAPRRAAAGPHKEAAAPRQVPRAPFRQTEAPSRPLGKPVKASDAARSTQRAVRAGAPSKHPVPAGAYPTRRLNAAETEVAERLHKVMARAGVASRRHSEELIQAGRVTVNGKVVTELGIKVVAGKDLIEVDGRPLGRPENLVYLLLNKPKGYVTTLFDPQGRPKVTDLLEEAVAERVYPVGRLDYDTEGLLVLTNDGDLANGLMHPARLVKKTYVAKVRGVPGPAKLRALEEGIELEDGMTAPAEAKMLEVRAPNSATVSLRIHEGRNRQVRRMFEALGHEVIHLKRSNFGPLSLKELPVGQWRHLTPEEVADLYRAAGLRVGGRAPAPKRANKTRTIK